MDNPAILSKVTAMATEYDILHEYPYCRHPGHIAEYLCSKFSNKKLLIYGDGFHTKEMLDYLEGHENIVGVVKNATNDSGFVRTKQDVPLYDVVQITNLKFDYLILLGYWTKKSCKVFAKEHGIKISKIIDIYRAEYIQCLSERLLQDKVFGLLGNAKTTLRKLAVILRHDSRDIITTASQELSKYFELTKIYIGNEAKEDNQYFSNVIFCKNDGSLYKVIIEKSEFDIAVFNNVNSNGIALAHYTKNLLAARTKFVYVSTENSYSGVIPFTYTDYKEQTGVSKTFVQVAKSAHQDIISNADGYIANIKYNFADTIRSKRKNYFFCMHFVRHDDFVFNTLDVVKKPIKLCYIGAMCVSSAGKTRVIQTQDMLGTFNSITKSSDILEIHIYASTYPDIDSLREVGDLHRLHIHNHTAHSMLPQTISKYHFGLIMPSMNLSVGMKKILTLNYQSYLHPKFMSYIAAGLPIIVHEAFGAVARIVKKHKIGIVVSDADLSTLESVIHSYEYDRLRCNVHEYQLKYIASNVPLQLKKYFDDI